jgi:GH15 family glucan-1,4-alpha-glucosidase
MAAEHGLPPLPPPGGEADRDFLPLRDYGLIGDCHGAALVGRDGSIDWCCFDRFDTAPCLARLLDRRQGGFLLLRPEGEVRRVTRRYIGDSALLETVFETAEGCVAVTDLMPVSALQGGFGPPGWIVRLAEGREGAVAMRAAHRPVRDLGAGLPPLALDRGRQSVLAKACPSLHAEVPFAPAAAGEPAVARFTLRAGERRAFLLAPEGVDPGAPGAMAARFAERTAGFWRDWSARIAHAGPYAAAVRRSAVVLKLLTYQPSGAMVAAPTTSLPEALGGCRNWDYRYCWPRDASFVLYALQKLGLAEETEAFFRFLTRAAADTLPCIPPLFAIDGQGWPAERVVEGLEGYMGSRPVRVGNGAVAQHQLDVYGQLLDLIHLHARADGGPGPPLEGVGIALADYVAAHWREPDHGIWEPRLPPRRHVHSAIMAWVALDRARDLFGPRPAWDRAAEEVLAEIRARGVHPREGMLTQVMEGDALDAAVLVAPMVGLPISDDILAHTVDAVAARLGEGPLVWRYRNEDGLPGEEGSFLVCAFWLVDALLALDRVEEARGRFEALLARGNDLGLFPEEMAADGTFLGNYPQAFTHLGLVQSALLLELHEAGGAAALRGTHADRSRRLAALRGEGPAARRAGG